MTIQVATHVAGPLAAALLSLATGKPPEASLNRPPWAVSNPNHLLVQDE